MSYRRKMIFVNMPRIFLAYILCQASREREIIAEDSNRWRDILKKEFDGGSFLMDFGYYLIYKKEFRNVLFYRLKKNPIIAVLFRILFPIMDTLYIETPKIGGGCLYNMVLQQ